MTMAFDRRTGDRPTRERSGRADDDRAAPQASFAVPVAGLVRRDPDGQAAPGVRNELATPTSIRTTATDSADPLSQIRVRYNSSEPAKLHARAFARGRDIHLAPGQEDALLHELWHVVQQRRDNVPADGTVNGIPVNVDPARERDAAHHARTRVFAAPLSDADELLLDHGVGRSGEVAQLLIISPPAASLDTIITLSIYRQLRSGTDDRVASFELFKAGGLDLSKERAIHIQGHGNRAGVYEEVASGLAIGSYLVGKVPDDVMICLDYCFSHMAATEVKAALPTAKVLANKNVASTQGTGEVISKFDPVPPGRKRHADELRGLVDYILASPRWTNAQRMTRALSFDLSELQRKGLDSVASVTELFRSYGELIWRDVGFLYGVIYHYNTLLTDPAAKTVL